MSVIGVMGAIDSSGSGSMGSSTSGTRFQNARMGVEKVYHPKSNGTANCGKIKMTATANKILRRYETWLRPVKK